MIKLLKKRNRMTDLKENQLEKIQLGLEKNFRNLVDLAILPHWFTQIQKSTFELEQHNKHRQTQLSARRHQAKERLADEDLVLACQTFLNQQPNPEHLAIFSNLMSQVRKRALSKAIILQGWQEHCWEHRQYFLERFTINRWYRFYWDILFYQYDKAVMAEWGRALGGWFGSAMNNPDITNHPRMMAWKRCMQECLHTSTDLILPRKRTEAYVDEIRRSLPLEDQQDITRLTQAITQKLGVPQASRGVRRYCEKYLFEALLNRYIDDVTNITVLQQLLFQFCDWQVPDGLERFNTLVEKVFNGPKGLLHLDVGRRHIIERHLKGTVGDPRLKHAAWGRCQGSYPELYRFIKAWFVQADFELFFRFAFENSHSFDPHQRKQLWTQYLSQAEDFRVFLPKNTYQEFLKTETDEARRSIVYKNLDEITGFIMLLNNVLIYEAVETRNACYIYDLEALEKDNQQKEVSRIKEFVSEVKQGKSGRLLKSSMQLFKNEHLAPLPKDTNNHPHRRFIHDKDLKWHGEVRQFLRTQFYIDPDKQ